MFEEDGERASYTGGRARHAPNQFLPGNSNRTSPSHSADRNTLVSGKSCNSFSFMPLPTSLDAFPTAWVVCLVGRMFLEGSISEWLSGVCLMVAQRGPWSVSQVSQLLTLASLSCCPSPLCAPLGLSELFAPQPPPNPPDHICPYYLPMTMDQRSVLCNMQLQTEAYSIWLFWKVYHIIY